MTTFISYDVTIYYMDLFQNEGCVKYSFYAKDRSDAERIGKECFLMEIGTANLVSTEIKATPLQEKEILYINDTIQRYIKPLEDSFEGINYATFLKTYQHMRGYDLEIGDKCSSFWFDFNSITCKCIYENGDCYLDTSLIIVRRTYDNRKYIIRGNFKEYFIGV